MSEGSIKLNNQGLKVRKLTKIMKKSFHKYFRRNSNHIKNLTLSFLIQNL